MNLQYCIKQVLDKKVKTNKCLNNRTEQHRPYFKSKYKSIKKFKIFSVS